MIRFVEISITFIAREVAAAPAADPFAKLARLAPRAALSFSCQAFRLPSPILAFVPSEWREPKLEPAVSNMLYSG